MPYLVIDTGNEYNPLNKRQFSTEAEAEEMATKELEGNPKAVLHTAKLLKVLKAEVTVTAKAPEDLSASQDEGGES